jgi:hypothetical protein
MCYEKMMVNISEELRKILKEEAPTDRDGESTFQDVHGKLFCAKGGTFMVRIKPTAESPPEQHLNLLYRWSDLYFEGFHSGGKRGQV